MTKVAAFEIEHSAFLDAEGRVLQALPDFAQDSENLIALYRAMVLTRAFDAKAVALQRTGRLGTYGSSLGQEAVAVGIGAAMAAEDVLVPSFREQGTQILRGVTLVEILLYWGGDERGSDFAGPRQDFPVCVPVGTHAPHAAGVALALQLRGAARAAVCVFGDGATSKGEVYEAMNFAGLRKLPLVFVVNNNQWAISVPRAQQSAAGTLPGGSILSYRASTSQAASTKRDRSVSPLARTTPAARSPSSSTSSTGCPSRTCDPDAVMRPHSHSMSVAQPPAGGAA